MMGDTICKLRNELEMSQDELSKLAGVSRKTIIKWETHEECPKITMIPFLVKILGDVKGDLFLYYYDYILGG